VRRRLRIFPTVSLGIVRGDKEEYRAWSYSWGTLFLGDTITGICPSRFRDSQSWDLQDSELKITFQPRPYLLDQTQTCLLIRKVALYIKLITVKSGSCTNRRFGGN
jgi:hypothetical protein